MSKYTTEVRYICETEYDGDLVGKSIDEILNQVYNKVMDFDFPIFDENYRKPLIIKILKHYYTREIGFETVALWKLKMNSKLNEIMPYFNKLYKSELLNFNPLMSADYTKEHTGSGTSNKNDSRTNNSIASHNENKENINLYSDTPQGDVNGLTENGFLTNATKDNTSFNSNDTSNFTDASNEDINTTDEYIDHISGYNGFSPNRLLKEFRDNILNIDMLVIDALYDMFFLLW